MERFDSKIHEAIDKWSYPIWFVLKDDNIICPCVNFTTKQADPNCTKCFSTGRKVKLRKVNTAHQNIDISIRGTGLGTGEKNVISTYYTNFNTQAKEEDLILDGDVLDVVHHAYPMRSNHTEPVYYKYETTPMKSNSAIVKKNLKEFIRKAGYQI